MTEQKLLKFHGQWQLDTWTLNIHSDRNLVQVSAYHVHLEYFGINWEIQDEDLFLQVFGNSLTMTLKLTDDGTQLIGTQNSNGKKSELTFTKTNDTPILGAFRNLLELTFEQRRQKLKEFPDFADDGVEIEFKYDLNRRDLYADLIAEFELDTVASGLEDVELMIALQKWTTDTFKHDGMSGMPEIRNAITIVDYLREYPGINCRLHAILLAELLRLYGIKAQHITVYSSEDEHPVHVVTHAYSAKLQQWIMLDPTQNAILKDKDGNLHNLLTLRSAFANDEPLFINDDANYNGEKTTIDDYMEFMSSYLFRFSANSEFPFDVKEADITAYMLYPVGFVNPEEFKFTIPTTSANVFFAKPG